MRFLWAAWVALAAACASPPPAPPTTDPGPFPADHGQLISAYLTQVLQRPASAQITLRATPTRYDAAATPLSPAVTTWAACYSVDAKGDRGPFTGARSYLALFRGGSLYDVIVDEARTTATLRRELARICATPLEAAPAAAAGPLTPAHAQPTYATGSAPLPLHPDGRPVIPGVLAVTETTALKPSAAAPTGQYAYPAEQLARRMNCAFDRVWLTGKGPGYETFGVRCDKQDKPVVIRCEYGHCRAIP